MTEPCKRLVSDSTAGILVFHNTASQTQERVGSLTPPLSLPTCQPSDQVTKRTTIHEPVWLLTLPIAGTHPLQTRGRTSRGNRRLSAEMPGQCPQRFTRLNNA